MKKKAYAIGIGSLIILAAFVITKGMIDNKPLAQKKAKADVNLAVKISEVKNTKETIPLYYTGRVGSSEYVELATEVSGTVLKTNTPLKEGQNFKKGELLLELSGSYSAATLKSVKSDFLKVLSSNLPDFQVDFPEYYPKWEAFFEEIDMESPLPIMPKIESNKEKIFLASNSILSGYYAVVQQEVNVSCFKMYAPFDGYYKSVNKEVGTYASADAVIAEIVRSDKLEIVVPVGIDDAKKLKVGSSVFINTEQGNLKAKLKRKAGFVDELTQSVNIYLEYYTTIYGELLEGEYVTIEFDLDSQNPGILVPRESVMDDNTVFTVSDGKLKKSGVEVIQHLEDQILIGGLIDGESVVIESLLSVSEGQVVQTIN